MAVPEIPGAAMTKEDAAMIHRMLVRGTRVRVRLESAPRERHIESARQDSYV